MDAELLGMLEKKVEELLAAHSVLKRERERLNDENQRLIEERNVVRQRIDAILAKLEEVSGR
jgi:cell division protein ZapB